MASRPPYPGTPRWVKAFGIIVIVVVLLAVVGVLIGGEHSPGRHTPSGEAGVRVPLTSVMEDHAPPGDDRG